MEMEKKLLLEKVYSDYVDIELNGNWNDLEKDEVEEGKYEIKGLIKEWKKFRLGVSGGEKSNMGGGVGMSSIEGFIKEIEWFDNMMYDYNGDYRGICKWECREGLFEILDEVIEDEVFRNKVKKEFNEYFGGWDL
jgi:hypothetical protein